MMLISIHEKLKLFNCQNVQPQVEDEYIVEKIVEKKFNNRLRQYEFLVKMEGLLNTLNTYYTIWMTG